MEERTMSQNLLELQKMAVDRIMGEEAQGVASVTSCVHHSCAGLPVMEEAREALSTES
jgi:hypothetical protein